MEDFVLSVPTQDCAFVKTLAARMGWTMREHRKSGLDEALDDIREGRVYKAKSVDDLFQQLEA
ncbi:MAG: hypothetical protein J1E37_07815 [Prevotella sp.]|nr:hypothetical protein [Prevotella sp.]